MMWEREKKLCQQWRQDTGHLNARYSIQLEIKPFIIAFLNEMY